MIEKQFGAEYGPALQRGFMTGRRISPARIADTLDGVLGRPVTVDRSGRADVDDDLTQLRRRETLINGRADADRYLRPPELLPTPENSATTAT
jgi:hypothetical protein